MYGTDVQTSAAYLQRLQDFLAQQQGSTSPSDKTTTNLGNKRKSPSTSSNIDTASAIKDRRQSSVGSSGSSNAGGQGNSNGPVHSHTANDGDSDGV